MYQTAFVKDSSPNDSPMKKCFLVLKRLFPTFLSAMSNKLDGPGLFNSVSIALKENKLTGKEFTRNRENPL